MTPADGGQAFPFVHWKSPDEMMSYGHNPGMSLRDWFAGMALSGMLASTTENDWDVGNLDAVVRRNVVSEAFRVADAMLVARVKCAK